MTVEIILFLALAVVAIAAALGLLLSQNAIYSALYLVVNFAVVAVLYLLLGAPFLAMIQITVYAGAIMVLFMFVIMLLGAEQLQKGEEKLLWQRPFGVILGAALVAIAGYVLITTESGVLPPPVADPSTYGSPAAIGLELYQAYLFPFEVTSVLLLAAMVGAVVLILSERTRRLPRKSLRSQPVE
jgi:NADH-quinone oxidoreductase subunit J